jgi:hypothetical protein
VSYRPVWCENLFSIAMLNGGDLKYAGGGVGVNEGAIIEWDRLLFVFEY